MNKMLACLAMALMMAGSPALAVRGKKVVKPIKAPTTTTTTTAKPERAPADPRAAAPAAVDPDAPVLVGTRKGPARIEFDDRLVQGQTNKANAIYLFERRESALRSLLKKRTHFHEEIDEMLEDELVR